MSEAKLEIPLLNADDDAGDMTRRRSKTMSRKEMARDLRRRRLAGELDPEEQELIAEIEGSRPKTRADCVNGPRPCNFVSCKHNLYLDVNPETGSIKLNFPDKEIWELEETCALDVAEKGGITLEEVGALVDEAHMRGRMVSAHVRGERSSAVAARAGVDSIEHATYASDDTLKAIRDQGLTLVPGLRYLYSIIENGPRFGITEDVIGPSGLRDEIKQAADTYRRARDLGIRMCPGGDFGFAWCPHGEYARDIQVFVDVIGFTPLEALTCATRNGAELMRMQDRIGTLAPGKLADLVVVDGDPLRDIAVLQDRGRLSVMKGGAWVTRRFGPAAAAVL